MGNKNAQITKAQVFKGATLTKDNKKQVKDGKFVLTEMNGDFGNDWVDVDMAMPDAIDMLDKIKEEDDPDLVLIREKLDAIQESLNVELPPLSAVEGKDAEIIKQSRKAEVAKQDLAIITHYNELIAECDKILEDEDADVATAMQIKEIRDKVAVERDELENAVYRFRQILSGAGAESRSRKRTYADALRFQRGEYYDLDDKEARYSNAGAGTSFLLVIEKEDGKIFFKQDESTTNDPIEVHAARHAKNYDLPVNLLKEVTPMLQKDAKRGVVGKTNLYRDLIRKFVFKLQDNDKDTKNPNAELTEESVFDSVNKLIDEYNKANPRQKQAIRKWAIDFGIRVNSDEMAKNAAGIKPGSNLTHRHVATSRMATLLGLDKIVASSMTATVKKDGQIITGNAMSEAEDTPEAQLKVYDFDAMQQLMQLQILDVVCAQADRKFGNYTNKANEKGRIKSICAIDNDMSFGEMRYEDMQKKLTPLNYNLLPKETIDYIKNLDTKKLRFEFMDLLSTEEIKATIRRINTLKKRIERTETFIEGLSDDEKKILNDPQLGPVWVMFTYACNPGMAKTETLFELDYIPKPKTLQENIKILLQKKNMLNIDMSEFVLLQNYHSFEPYFDNRFDDDDDFE